ncbi:MAG: hypothetical protein LBT22_09340 [Peptococcaceae bacterium]|nr:hypothetical protein [Peptococcaceae bacterium]
MKLGGNLPGRSGYGRGYSPGSIRNPLGPESKNAGLFSKERSLPPQGGNMGTWMGGNGTPWQRELILQAAQPGVQGSGVATISSNHTFLLIANLPPPQTFFPGMRAYYTSAYACYLVDKKGSAGFMAGVLNPIGNGVYRVHFQSPVPLTPYERVVVSVENPQNLGQAPKGPIILKVKEPWGPVQFLTPMVQAAKSVGGKIGGLFNRESPPAPEAGSEGMTKLAPEFAPEAGTDIKPEETEAPRAEDV